MDDRQAASEKSLQGPFFCVSFLKKIFLFFVYMVEYK